MEELKIVVTQKEGIITTNFDTIKENLKAQMEVYKELEVTEENKAERKKDIATLRKIQKAADDKKKEVKQAFIKPYMDFENNVKEIIGIIQEPIDMIDGQVKEFEDNAKKLRRSELTSLYEESIGDIDISLEQFYDPKWENSSVSMKSAKEELLSKIESIKKDISVIESMNSEKVEAAINHYISTLNLSDSIAIITKYEQQKKEIEEKLKKEQEAQKEAEAEKERERIREEERKRVIAEQKAAKEAEEKEAEAYKVGAEDTAQEMLSIKEKHSEKVEVDEGSLRVFNIVADDSELDQIRMYLDSIGIEYWED